MTKHGTSRARKAGDRVGTVLANRNKKGGPIATSAMFRHTTDITNGQSILERGDLEELMAMADLADRDFTAERTQVVVISTGAVDPLAEERDAQERREAEDRHRHRLRLPRRPTWNAETTPEQLDLQERTSFLSWRRDLACMEEEEKLVLTPFERNLEVWRQLWRVLERSDVVVQVVDARDPLLYRSTDLEAYARELHDTKASFILLNKADLLPVHVRRAWADFFDKAGLDYAFWSAFLVIQDLQQLKADAAELGVDVFELKAQRQLQERQRRLAAAERGEEDEEDDERVRLLDGEELLELMEDKARAAVQAAGPEDPRSQDASRRLVVGLVGYPNVGKSSTINALFGSKKTAVAPTPGKTKHFQTLNVSPSLCLCDCPGLVMPVFANSKAEMVAAGVIPIDRLVDIRSPVEVIAKRLGRWQLEHCYGIRLPPPLPHELPSTPPSAMQLLRSLAVLRGWTAGSGLPDESRAGRTILRDYTSGKLVYCLLPPESSLGHSWVPGPDDLDSASSGEDSDTEEDEAAEPGPDSADVDGPTTTAADMLSEGVGARVVARTKYVLPNVGPVVPDRPVVGGPGSKAGSSRAATAAAAAAVRRVPGGGVPLDAADLDMLEGIEQSKANQRRPGYKFNKKAARSKGDRGQERGEGAFDGGAMTTGKKGGLVRMTAH